MTEPQDLEKELIKFLTHNELIKKVKAKMNKDITEEEQLAQLRDVGIERKGTKLTVPEGIDLGVAIRALQLQREDEEQDININHLFEFDAAEGMVAFLRVLQREYGFVSNKGKMGFFGRQNPSYIGIETSPGNVESIPNGNLQIPGIEGYLSPAYQPKDNRIVFALRGVVKGKNRQRVDELAALIKEECKVNSIYKGHAIVTSFPDVEDTDCLEDTFAKFAEMDKISPEDILLNEQTYDDIDVSLFTPIRRTQMCRDNNIPLKRGVLLHGPYGTGKSMTAAATATICKENGWTFIYLKDVTKISKAYAFAKNYQPAVIFSEDIDQVLKVEKEKDRDAKVNQILNEIDGIDTKGLEIITVLTTNHIEKITQAALRPGRFDGVIRVDPPNQNTVERLIRMYAGNLLSEDVDISSSSEILQGEVPALIREVVERSKLSAIRREGELRLNADDILLVARSMKNHMELLKPKEIDQRTDIEKGLDSLGRLIGEKATFTISDLAGAPKQLNGASENHQTQSV